VFHGEEMRNHNHLLGVVEGVDGIKTGFTRASGFNLLTSLHRDGRYLVAVVMGGPSAAERDERMRELLRAHIKEAAVRRTAPMIAEAAEPREETARKAPAAHVERTPATSVETRIAAGSNDPIRPVLVKTISYRTAPVQTSSLGPMPALVPVGAPASPAQAQAAQQGTASQPANSPIRAEIAAAAPAVTAPQTAITAAPPTSAAPAPSAQSAAASIAPKTAPSAATRVAQSAVPSAAPSLGSSVAPSVAPTVAAAATTAPTATGSVAAPPSNLATMPVPAIKTAAATELPPASTVVERAKAAEPAPIQMQPAQIEPALEMHAYAPIAQPAPAYTPPHVHAHGGWLIQIGAFDDELQAKQHLSAAQMKVHAALAAKDPFTERIQKGDKALYRARFAGFDKATAEAACKTLKRSDFECMALKD
jgi:D-alanyl-D-alanine carboxypeptidase